MIVSFVWTISNDEEKNGGPEHTTPLLHCQTSGGVFWQLSVMWFRMVPQSGPLQVMVMEREPLPSLHMADEPVRFAMAGAIRLLWTASCGVDNLKNEEERKGTQAHKTLEPPILRVLGKEKGNWSTFCLEPGLYLTGNLLHLCGAKSRRRRAAPND